MPSEIAIESINEILIGAFAHSAPRGSVDCYVHEYLAVESHSNVVVRAHPPPKFEDVEHDNESAVRWKFVISRDGDRGG